MHTQAIPSHSIQTSESTLSADLAKASQSLASAEAALAEATNLNTVLTAEKKAAEEKAAALAKANEDLMAMAASLGTPLLLIPVRGFLWFYLVLWLRNAVVGAVDYY